MFRLKKIKITEIYNNRAFWSVGEIDFDSYNLIIGPNAVGKSQFIKRLKWLSSFHTGYSGQKVVENVLFNIEFLDEESSDIISYELAVKKRRVHEKIRNKSKKIDLFDTSTGIFFNEETQKPEERLTVGTHSICLQVNNYSKQYPTIDLIGDFFNRIKFINADQLEIGTIVLTSGSNFPNPKLTNLSSVILRLKKFNKKKYHLILDLFQQYFPYIESFEAKKLQNSEESILAFKEKNIPSPTSILDVSLGMFRILGIITMTACEDLTNKPASAIIIDEIDNGLDFANLGILTQFIKDSSDQTQFIFSSHSPVMCNLIEIEKWRIFSRSGINTKVSKLEKTIIEELREKMKLSNWDIFKEHVFAKTSR